MKKNNRSIESILQLIAAIISIFQFIISFPSLILSSPIINYEVMFADSQTALRIVLVIILETSIAYFASVLYRKSEEKYYPIGRYILIIIIISAITVWTSLFDFQHILIGRVMPFHDLLLFSLLTLASFILSGFFILLEMEKPIIVLVIRSLGYLIILLSLFLV